MLKKPHELHKCCFLAIMNDHKFFTSNTFDFEENTNEIIKMAISWREMLPKFQCCVLICPLKNVKN